MEVELPGGKFNLTDVAARVGLGQLPHLARFNARRGELARRYFTELRERGAAEFGLQLPVADFANSNWHMFQVVLPEERLTLSRAQVMEKLAAAGIGTGVHYPAIHLFALYRRLGFKPGDFPIAETVCRNILTLPLFADMRDADVPRVAEALMQVLRSGERR
jgi:dTDP-4-amino-4,6-dideoxygalactose transaminase